MEFFGNTLKEIAHEKDGIIKPGVPVVLGPMKAEAYQEIADYAADMHAEIIELPEAFVLTEDGLELDGDHYAMRVGAAYLKQNAAVALLAAEQAGIDIHSVAVHAALAESRWPGRFETVSEHPHIILDGAHNPDGAKSLCESVKTYFPNKKITLVMGVFKDKDYDQILETMANVSDTLIAFTPKHPRGLASHELKKQATKYFAYVEDGETAQKSFSLAKEKTNPKDVVLIFGSLSTIADFYDIING
jgi:dihydrofolate synthase/folylpolyglutamate synthase